MEEETEKLEYSEEIDDQTDHLSFSPLNPDKPPDPHPVIYSAHSGFWGFSHCSFLSAPIHLLVSYHRHLLTSPPQHRWR